MENNATKGIRVKVSEENKRLYHYTTWDGLVGILKNQSLWATHYKFLNDYSETLLLKDKLIELTRPIIHQEYRNIIDGHLVGLGYSMIMMYSQAQMVDF